MAEIRVTLQFRRATTEEWEANENTIPSSGEPCYDTTLKELRIGDGKTPYKDLNVIIDELTIDDKITNAIGNIINESELQNVLDSVLGD